MYRGETALPSMNGRSVRRGVSPSPIVLVLVIVLLFLASEQIQIDDKTSTRTPSTNPLSTGHDQRSIARTTTTRTIEEIDSDDDD
jgi:hypothetical protein